MPFPLPDPSTVTTRRPVQVEANSVEEWGVQHSRHRDAFTPDAWTLEYRDARAVVRDAILEHYLEHCRQPFAWTPPGASEVTVMYVGAPSFRRVGRRWNAELTLAQEP